MTSLIIVTIVLIVILAMVNKLFAQNQKKIWDRFLKEIAMQNKSSVSIISIDYASPQFKELDQLFMSNTHNNIVVFLRSPLWLLNIKKDNWKTCIVLDATKYLYCSSLLKDNIIYLLEDNIISITKDTVTFFEYFKKSKESERTNV